MEASMRFFELPPLGVTPMTACSISRCECLLGLSMAPYLSSCRTFQMLRALVFWCVEGYAGCAFYVPDFVASWAQGPSHAWVHNFPGSMPPSRCVRRRTAVNRLVFSRVRCETLLPRRDSLWLLSSIRRYTVDSKWVVNPTSRGGDFIKREDSSQTSQSKAAIGTIGPLYHR